MKHILFSSSLLFAGGTILMSCSSDELFGTRENVKRIEASICDFVMEDGATRTSHTLGGNGYEAVWATGDVLGIYPLGGDQVAFPISDGVGTTLAKFDGGAWALRGTYQYAAYYPFSTDNYTISETAIPISYLGQTQTANNSVTHFADYDFMAAAATSPDASGSVTLPFKHLSSYLILPLTLPKAGTYTQLTLTSDKGEFITKGTVDLSAASPAITATETSSSISMNLDNIVLTSDNLVLTANMLIAPVNLTGSTITIAVKDADGAIYTNKEKAWTRSAAFLANTTYKASRTLAGSGTGGEIEGGGGLEEDDDTSATTGTAKATIGGSEVDVNWVQLWAGGPKFAEYNVGVTNGKAESYGGYYCWGSSIDKDSNNAYKIGNDALIGTDDTATNLWGSAWRMPTQAELEALLANCDTEWTTVNGINGRIFTGKGDYASNSVFLPAAGFCAYGLVRSQGDFGRYWSSTPDGSYYAYYLFFDSGSQNVYSGYRYNGYSVRAVLAEEPESTGTAKATIEGRGEVDVNWVQLWTDGPKFAEYNVGVTDGKAESYGGYYCWGSSIDKDSNGAYKSGTDALTGDDDTATKLWGSAWRMPTQAELEALLTNCDVEWTTVGGVNGRKFTGKVAPYTSNSVFLPAAGSCEYGDVNDQGDYGYYWSSTPFSSYYAFYLRFNSGDQDVDGYNRYGGYSVRAVLAE